MRLFTALTLVLLSGCANSITHIQNSTRQAQVECENRFIAGEYKKQVEVAGCINSAISEAALEGNNKDMDLIELANAKRMELALNVDKKRITKEQADLELAQLNSYVASEERSRKLNAINTYANFRQATTPPPAPVYVQPVQRGFTCHQMGHFMNCN